MSTLWSYLLITVCLLHQVTADDEPPKEEAWCTKPTIENVSIISENKEYYNNGDEVEVQCNPGYYPSSDTMRCDNAHTPPEWTPPTITCIGVTLDWRVNSSSISVRIFCTPQCLDTWNFTVRCCPEPDNSGPCKTSQDRSVTFTDLQPSSTYRIQTNISTVKKTYNLEPIDIHTEDSAQCKRPTIENVESLSIDKNYYDNGKEVTIRCKSGYHPSAYTMRCDNPPEWTPPTVTCTAQCKKPIIENVDSLSMDKNYYDNGEEVTVRCQSGYYPSSYTMRCDNPPEWTPPTVTCTALCRKPEETILTMYPKKIFYDIDERVTVKCPPGYQNLFTSVQCVNYGSSIGWNNLPQCIAQCSPPTIPNMGYISVYKTYYNKYEEITVQCQSGYYPSSSTMRCDNPRTSRDWTPPSVTCMELCRNPDETILEMNPKKIFYKINERVTVTCPPGYLNPYPSVWCVNFRSSIVWNNPPQCIALCKKPDGIILTMDPKKTFYNIWDSVTVTCSPGYRNPHPSVQCVMSGSSIYWNNPPQCIAQCSPPTIPNMERVFVYKNYYNEGDVVRVRCIEGYYPSSSVTIRCNNPHAPQEWAPPTITCTGVTMDWKVNSSSISVRISCTPQCPDIWRITVQCCPEPKNYKSCKTLSDKSVTFTDLQPFSKYRIETTLYQWGQSLGTLKPIYIQTEDSVPGRPKIMKVPSMEDNTITWILSEKWGKITGFQMNISAWRDYNVSFAADESLQFAPKVTQYKIPLQYGTNYTIALRGFTSAGAGGVTTQNIDTDIGDPPLHMEKTMTDDTLQLHPVLNLNGPIRSYEIIVFGGQEDNSTKECLNFTNFPYNSSWTPTRYTAAVLPAEDLTEPRTFTLGDNHHYNGFHNAPLIPNANYTVYIRVTSHWNHVEKSSCAFAGFLQIHPEPASSNTRMIAGSIVTVILLLILLLMVILWRSRSSSKSRRSSNIPLKLQIGIGKKRDIPVDKFLEVVKSFRKAELVDNDEDEEENANISPVGRYLEYQDLPGGFGNPCTAGQAEENQAKNRYKKVLPYDDSRVVLRSGPSRSDYINASYINGYKTSKLYIATQGPLPETLADFWRMVWQENSSVIVMLTGLQEKNKVKCECYWPEQSHTYGDITVSVQKIIQTGAVTIRSFSLKKVQSAVQITVEHLQYLRWPDHGVPRNSSDLVQLIELMNKCNTPGSGPVIVHCSAGIGRTGTFIALDILLKMAHAVNKVNVYNCVSELRKKRVKMVQEKEQYIFLYDALLEGLLCGNTIVPVSDIQKRIGHMTVRDGRTNVSGYDKEFQDVEKLTELYQIYQCKEGKKPENQEKNRNPDILPGDHWRPALMSALNTRGAPGYINAVFVTSNSKEEVLIATQLPMKQTLADFWALVWDYKCTVMVMMQRAQDLQENGCRFFPDKGETGYGIYKVRMTAKASRNGFTDLTLSLRKTNETYNNSMEVKLWCLDSWPLGKPLPENPAAVISLIGEVEKHQMTVPESHILVTCCDGASRSGLFCAGIILCEQIRSDGCLDVSQAVRSLRRRRCQFIPNVEQYSFCYTLAQSYLDSFETYGNFK